jgi:hypothetical protein
MNINLEFDSSVEKAPAGFTTAVQAAANALDALLTDPITVNISVGFGEIGGSRIPSPISEGGPLAGTDLSYAEVQQEFAAHLSSAAQPEMLANLPAADPSGGSGFYVSPAEEKAWGLLPADGTELDGQVGFTVESDFNYNPNDRNDPSAVDFVGIAEHELTHALGRVSDQGDGAGFSVLDLTRYASPGVLASAATTAPYFSIDGGNTNLNFYDTKSDPADWAASAGADAFDAVGVFGTENGLTSADQTLMNVLGFAVSNIACFAAGTQIAVAAGEVPVERLRVGDAVRTQDGGTAPVRWLGRRRMEPAPEAAWPVRIAPGAFAGARPRRVLLLSPDHALYLDGALIPVRYLVNGSTVARVPVRAIDYWHVELDRHNVIFAEGLPCESYLDAGNRAAFDDSDAAAVVAALSA